MDIHDGKVGLSGVCLLQLLYEFEEFIHLMIHSAFCDSAFAVGVCRDGAVAHKYGSVTVGLR